MAYKTKYHGLSLTDITEFNNRLEMLSNEGYIPFGGIAVSSCYNEYHKSVINTYSVLLGKTTEVKD